MTLLLSLVIAALSGAIVAYAFLKFHQPSQQDLIRDFYRVENAVHVSPHSIRKNIMKGYTDSILVDLRSQEEYEAEHIVGAVNIPAYKDPDTSAYGDVERIVSSFEELIAQNPDTDIVVYCYSIPCMTGRKIGQMLAEHGIFVKHLGVGWNEWRYHWELWNHPHEWSQTIVADYVISGKEPGEFKGVVEEKTFCLPGEFGC